MNQEKIQKKKKAFTLVELIIVITILAVLASIAFLSYANYTVQSRDTKRMADVSTIWAGLQILFTQTGKYPLPNSEIEIWTGSGNILSYQWNIEEPLQKLINIFWKVSDPKDESYYTYATNKNRNKYQVMTFLEQEKYVYLPFLSPTFANETHPYVYGDTVGILTDENNIPLQNYQSNIDLSTSTGSYILHTGNEEFSWSNTDIIVQMIASETNTLACTSVIWNNYTLWALNHNETWYFSKTSSLTHGTNAYSLEVKCLNGNFDVDNSQESVNTTCESWYVANNNDCVLNECSGSIPSHGVSNATSQGFAWTWWYDTTAGLCSFICDTNYTWDGDSCEANTQNTTCTSLPNNASWNTVNSLTQTWDGSSWTPSALGTYNTTPSTSECRFTCDSGYLWDGDSCELAQTNPSNLTLNHTTRNKNFTVSWTAGIGNGWAWNCKLQYNKSGTWTDISATTYNCDTNASNIAVTLPASWWYSGNWNGTSIRLMRISSSTLMGTFPTNLLCTTTSASSSSTPNIDEDCNGNWDNSVSGGCSSYAFYQKSVRPWNDQWCSANQVTWECYPCGPGWPWWGCARHSFSCQENTRSPTTNECSSCMNYSYSYY